MQGRSWAIWADLGVQLIPIAGFAIYPGVGVIGLLGALYAGLGWVANLREALTAMWESQHESGGFLATKAKDLAALLGLGAALVLSLGLSALAGGGVMRGILEWLNLDSVPGVGVALRVFSILLALAGTWALFTWVISRLPQIGRAHV